MSKMKVGIVVVVLGMLGIAATAWGQASLREVVERCGKSYVLFHLPLFGSDEDFCTSIQSHYVVGDDVSRRPGRQLDIIDLLKQVRILFIHPANPPLLHAFARDLEQCIDTYYDHGSTRFPDHCRIAGRHAKGVWKHRPKVKAYLDRRRQEADILSRMGPQDRIDAEYLMAFVETFWSLPEVVDATVRVLRRHPESFPRQRLQGLLRAGYRIRR